MIVSQDDGLFFENNSSGLEVASGHQISADTVFCSDMEGVTLPLFVLMQSLMSRTTEPQSTKGARLVALPSRTKETFRAAIVAADA